MGEKLEVREEHREMEGKDGRKGAARAGSARRGGKRSVSASLRGVEAGNL